MLGIYYLEICGKFGVGSSTACKKVNTAGTDENLFRLVPLPRHGAQVLPLGLVRARGCLGTVPKFVLGHPQKAMFRLVPVPEHRRARARGRCLFTN